MISYLPRLAPCVARAARRSTSRDVTVRILLRRESCSALYAPRRDGADTFASRELLGALRAETTPSCARRRTDLCRESCLALVYCDKLGIVARAARRSTSRDGENYAQVRRSWSRSASRSASRNASRELLGALHTRHEQQRVDLLRPPSPARQRRSWRGPRPSRPGDAPCRP